MRFHKYSSTGNDFIIFDHQAYFQSTPPSPDWVQKVCKRKVSVGADGLILVKKMDKNTVAMTYFNSDGQEVEMCGNGLRAVARYCCEVMRFQRSQSVYVKTKNSEYEVLVPNYLNIKIKMAEVDQSKSSLADKYDASYLEIGVPHVVKELESISSFPLDLALEIRNDHIFKNGTNVNFFTQVSQNEIRVRTFERGVEAETLSCGTGVTASAITFMWQTGVDKVFVRTEGGQLIISKLGEDYFLEGPSDLVFIGELPEV